MPNIIIKSKDNAIFKDRKMPLTIGENGFCKPSDKQEGDLKTPKVNFKPLALYYRPDRVPLLNSCLPIYEITPNSGWCDDPKSSDYNQFVPLPYNYSAENLYRDDHRYDYIIVTDYNYPNAISGKGSAIFIHIMHEDGTPTAGCLGFKQEDLEYILKHIKSDDYFILI